MRKVCELGRSMVEMLGVLAIIGVLSVGGIAGYSKAMFKYKMTKLTTGIYYLMDNLDLLLSHNDYDIGENMENIISKMNLLPDGFTIKTSNSVAIYDPFDHLITSRVALASSQKTVIALVINKSEYDICINFLSQVTLDNRDLSYIGISHTNETASDYAEKALYYKGRNINYIGNKSKILQLCDKCKSKSDEEGFCRITIEYYITNH